jgi:hypothetical protein
METTTTKSVMKMAVYFCATSDGRWAKSFSISEVKKLAGANRKNKIVIWACLFNETETEAEKNNLKDCITGNALNGNPEFYKDNRTDEDTKMITKYFLGWLVIENTIETKK